MLFQVYINKSLTTKTGKMSGIFKKKNNVILFVIQTHGTQWHFRLTFQINTDSSVNVKMNASKVIKSTYYII